MERIYLVGSESVENAGSSIRAASERMEQVARNLEGSADRFLAKFEELVVRLEALAEKE